MIKALTIFLVLVLIVATSCKQHEGKTPLKVPEIEKANINEFKVTIDSSIVLEMTDSLNRINDFTQLPDFLSDSCLDGNTSFWPDLHHPISVRQKVIANVTNSDLLEYIKLHKLYRNTCFSDKANFQIPYAAKSNFDLAIERLNELKAK